MAALAAGTEAYADPAAPPVRVRPSWLSLREPVDAAARSTELPDLLRPVLDRGARLVVHDLGCGTGSMGRWLAPRLGGPQHWVLHDRDADLLVHAARERPEAASGGATVSVETRRSDVTRLRPDDLEGASLVTASALLDMMTADEVDRFAATASSAGCPVLVTISVVGRVELRPADPLDADVTDAFNAHQRRTAGGRRLLGPDAAERAAEAFERHGHDVVLRPSPWRLDHRHGTLLTQWLTGWIGAACEQRPELVPATSGYTVSRLADARTGRLDVTVAHLDLLALPR